MEAVVVPCWQPIRPERVGTSSIHRADASGTYQAAVATPSDVCDYCASERIVWRKCKLICEQCGQINKSCADL